MFYMLYVNRSILSTCFAVKLYGQYHVTLENVLLPEKFCSFNAISGSMPIDKNPAKAENRCLHKTIFKIKLLVFMAVLLLTCCSQHLTVAHLSY